MRSLFIYYDAIASILLRCVITTNNIFTTLDNVVIRYLWILLELGYIDGIEF